MWTRPRKSPPIERTAVALALVCTLAGSALAARPIELDAVPLRYDDRLIARGFPSPVLRATIHGQSAWFIVDTGASVHTLASWLVSAARLRSRTTTATVAGSTGNEKPVRVVANQTLRLHGGPKLELREAIVVDLPAIFAENRIGGLLSPQLLAARGAASVLDLRIPMLRFDTLDSALTDLGHRSSMISTGSPVCRNADSPFVNRLYAALVTADTTAGTMLVDTGATSTLVTPGSSMAAGLESRPSEKAWTRGVGGSAQATPKVSGVRLGYGGTTSTIAVTIGGSAPSCGPDGRIGMDALRRCVLVLGESAFAWACDAE